MNNEEGTGSVDRLNERLNSQTSYEEPKNVRRGVVAREVHGVEESWKSPSLDEILRKSNPEGPDQPESNHMLRKIFLVALVFCLATGAVAAYVFFGGLNFVSTKNVDIKVVGPTSISAGEILDMEVLVTNKNNADLDVANLSIQYPQGTRDGEGGSQSLAFVRESLGSVGAGKVAVHNAKAVLFGEEGEIKEIKISVEYRVSGSNATFKKDIIYEVVIGDSPISVSISQPSTVISGDTFETTITLALNSNEVLKNVMLRTEHPYGYSVVESSASPLNEENLWLLGDLSPGTKKTLTIKGRLVGENAEERTFRYHIGVADALNKANFGTTLASTAETVIISRPSISLDVSLNNNKSATYVIAAGQTINGFIRYQNNLPEKILNPRVEVRFSGGALDKSSVVTRTEGFYSSQTNKITWNLFETLSSPELLPGDGGDLSFSFRSLPSLTNAGQEIKVEVVLLATSISDVSREIFVTERRTVKVASRATLSSRATYSIGAFTNKGPIPPQVDKETTYTLNFVLDNPGNNIENAKLTAILGPGVSWLGASNEEVSYNEANNTITWSAGTLARGTGSDTPSREVSVQVKLVPSISQIGLVPTLASSISFSGIDSSSGGEQVMLTNQSLSTRITSDPQFVQGDEKVVK